MFFGVEMKTEHQRGARIQCQMEVSHLYNFYATNQLSNIQAKNCAAREALMSLCDIENKFIHEQRSDMFEEGFGAQLERYLL